MPNRFKLSVSRSCDLISRRYFLCGGAAWLAFSNNLMPVREAFDHLLLGVSDLDHGIDWFERHAGVRAAIGGVHPGRGTRNALLSLGGAHYLEIIAPDPAQTAQNRQFQLGNLTDPRLINFAVRTNDISRTAAILRQADLHTIGPIDGSRRTASGELLRWKSLSVESALSSDAVNPIPFFIEWASGSLHPSRNSPPGCRIQDVRFEHPRAEELHATLRALGLEASVATAENVRIVASVDTPKGPLELA